MADKIKSIIFSADEVRSVLDGRKSMFRRVLQVPTGSEFYGTFNPEGLPIIQTQISKPAGWRKNGIHRVEVVECPFGGVGATIFVKETWYDDLSGRAITDGREHIYYRADGEAVEQFEDWADLRWRPAGHLPQWASRLSLRITSVKIEKLQDISEEDAIAEGMDSYAMDCDPLDVFYRDYSKQTDGWHLDPDRRFRDAENSYATFWNKQFGKKHPWASNPFCWVVSFEVLGGVG